MISLSDGEWKLMNLLWDESPLTIGRMVEALRGDTDWSKATVNIMLGRLAAKGAVSVDTGGRAKLYAPLLAREDAVREETNRFLGRIRTGGIGLLVSAMTEGCELSDEDIEELERILRKGKEHG